MPGKPRTEQAVDAMRANLEKARLARIEHRKEVKARREAAKNSARNQMVQVDIPDAPNGDDDGQG